MIPEDSELDDLLYIALQAGKLGYRTIEVPAHFIAHMTVELLQYRSADTSTAEPT